MKEYKTGAVRDTGGKGRMDLLPWCAIRRVSRHMEEGNKDHGERNWENGLPMHCFIDSAFRHLSKYMEGMTDEDHLCAAAWNVLCAMWTEENRPEMMDIPTRMSTEHTEPQQVCNSYSIDTVGRAHCAATRDQDYCVCCGDRRKCDFYEEVRNESK